MAINPSCIHETPRIKIAFVIIIVKKQAALIPCLSPKIKRNAKSKGYIAANNKIKLMLFLNGSIKAKPEIQIPTEKIYKIAEKKVKPKSFFKTAFQIVRQARKKALISFPNAQNTAFTVLPNTFTSTRTKPLISFPHRSDMASVSFPNGAEIATHNRAIPVTTIPNPPKIVIAHPIPGLNGIMQTPVSVPMPITARVITFSLSIFLKILFICRRNSR
ncbi:MAG: hypothetical protein IIW10_05450 [Spirochaetaceae bacterium]|nr:hypothetical protein [Spirochaetaceae bacterium]